MRNWKHRVPFRSPHPRLPCRLSPRKTFKTVCGCFSTGQLVCPSRLWRKAAASTNEGRVRPRARNFTVDDNIMPWFFPPSSRPSILVRDFVASYNSFLILSAMRRGMVSMALLYAACLCVALNCLCSVSISRHTHTHSLSLSLSVCHIYSLSVCASVDRSIGVCHLLSRLCLTQRWIRL